MQLIRRYRHFWIFLVLLLGSRMLAAQSLPVDENKVLKQYPHLSLVFNRVFNGGGLDSFYHQLEQLKKTKKGKVSIVHIGDSHLQSDHLTSVVRKGLQDYFGAAGGQHQTSKSMGGLMSVKDSNGVAYHSFGINGARIETYIESSAIWQQVAQLQPDLFIISLGTNDAQANVITDAELHRQMDQLIKKLRAAAPGSALLICTTADSFKNGMPNRELWNLNLSLFSYCTTNSIPVWDMYRVTNGFGSAWNWYRKGLMNGDGIHFSAAAYKIMGQLLYNALAKGYNSYISSY